MDVMLLLPLFLFVLGTLFGSFASVLVHRIYHREQGILWGRSKCTACGHQLAAGDLIPLLSYLWKRGKCGYCQHRLSWMYPFLEVVMGLLFLSVGFQFGVDGFSWPLLYMLVVMFVFVVMSVYDLLYMEIPDEVSLPSIAAALVVSAVWAFPVTIVDGLIGAAGILVFFGIQIWISKGRWLGLGDLRIGALMGLILGWQLSLLALFASYVLGSLIAGTLMLVQGRSMNTAVPFGPFLTLGFLVALFWGRGILDWYLAMILV